MGHSLFRIWNILRRNSYKIYTIKGFRPYALYVVLCWKQSCYENHWWLRQHSGTTLPFMGLAVRITPNSVPAGDLKHVSFQSYLFNHRCPACQVDMRWRMVSLCLCLCSLRRTSLPFSHYYRHQIHFQYRCNTLFNKYNSDCTDQRKAIFLGTRWPQ